MLHLLHNKLSEGNEKKSDVIKKYEIDYNSFVDDCMDNVVDVVLNTNSYEKEFLIPRYRYNIDIPESIKRSMLIDDLNIKWFDNDYIDHKSSGILVDRLHKHDYETWNGVA